jgi:hypothetical protein
LSSDEKCGASFNPCTVHVSTLGAKSSYDIAVVTLCVCMYMRETDKEEEEEEEEGSKLSKKKKK